MVTRIAAEKSIIKMSITANLLRFVIVIKPIFNGVFFNKYSVITNIATKDAFSEDHKPHF
jgi:hypothetical protein